MAGAGVWLGRVQAVARLTPRMVRVTLGGEGLAGLPAAGPAARVKLYFPQAGSGGRPVLPGDGSGRPVRRTYTVRSARAAAGEIDVDFVLHGDGPAALWAATAAPGDLVGLSAPRGEHVPASAGVDWLLWCGDETAWPAIAAMVESVDSAARGRVFCEVADAGEVQEVAAPAGVEVTWVDRSAAGAVPGRALVEAVRAAAWWPGSVRAWLAGESEAVRALRAHLQAERGVPRQAVYASGYWKVGRAEQ